MSEPYYQDDSVTLYHGRCEDVLPTLSLSGSVHLLTDPPYFKVKDNDWDNQWSKSAEFLDWMGEWLDLAKPHLTPNASVWVFAAPRIASEVAEVINARFRVLNTCRWVKSNGDASRRSNRAQINRFGSQWEGVIFAEQRINGTTPTGHFLRASRISANKSKADIERAIGYVLKDGRGSGIMHHWERGFAYPPREAWEKTSEVITLPPYAAVRRFFNGSNAPLDLLFFDSVPSTPETHPCEKPADLLAHMIETTTRPGDTILDCFSGSGAVLDVARQLGRKAIGIEMDEHWCRQTTKRLSQQTFDFGEMTA